MFKKALCLSFALLLSINSFAAVVSDNDGSAFITKAEFDSLKNNFQSQIDQYNTSIDSKIDSAIATYLAGIRVTKNTELSLDEKCHYSFPLCNDINGYWDDYTVNGGNLMCPEFHYTDYRAYIYALLNPGDMNPPKANWVWDDDHDHKIATTGNQTTIPSNADFHGGATQFNQRRYDYNGVNGLLNVVSSSAATRNINGIPYNLYELNDEGIGRLVHSYQAETALASGEGTMWGQTTQYATTTGHTCFLGLADEQYRVSGSGTSTRYNHQDPAGSFEPYKLTKSSLVTPGPTWSNQRNYDVVFPDGAEMTCTQISEKEFINSGVGTLRHYNFWTKNPLAESTNFTKPSVRTYIYTRNQFMPANANYNYALTADLQKGTNTIYTIAGGGENVLVNTNFWSTRALTVYAKPMIQPLAVPPLKTYKWHSSTKYAPDPDEAFSYLPATLVTYTDSNDKVHYMDEGMFLGMIKQEGEVSFDVMFQRDYGSGSQVELHISKKPFSYNCSESDLIEYKIEKTSGKKQKLDYWKEYTIKIENVNKNDELYLEWVPVTSSDLSSMTSFDNFYIKSDI